MAELGRGLGDRRIAQDEALGMTEVNLSHRLQGRVLSLLHGISLRFLVLAGSAIP